MTAMPSMRSTAIDSALAVFATLTQSADRAGGGGAPAGDSPGLRLDLDPDVGAASRARDALAQLDGHLENRQLEDIRLLVTELITNSVRHADSGTDEPVRLEVSVRDDRVFVAVEDGGNGFTPRARTDDSSDEGGWGLYLVDQVSERWGVDADSRTRVWLEVARSRRADGR
jgi:anti-sigma regulatory factor (Ser/Thr protein kinase)